MMKLISCKDIEKNKLSQVTLAHDLHQRVNMIINRWLTFPFVDMTWLDGKYYILCWVSI